jgi:hypothetical protein
MRKRRGETKQERAARKAHPDYPKSRLDEREWKRFAASKYIPGGKYRTVPVGNR